MVQFSRDLLPPPLPTYIGIVSFRVVFLLSFLLCRVELILLAFFLDLLLRTLAMLIICACATLVAHASMRNCKPPMTLAKSLVCEALGVRSLSVR